MFELWTMQYFLEIKPYSKEDLDKFGSKEALEEVVHYAWYLFCYKILQGVNHNWVSAMEDKNLLKKLPVFNYVMLSDLVLAVWIVYTHFELVTTKLNKNLNENTGETYFAGIDVQKKKSGREKGLKTGEHGCTSFRHNMDKCLCFFLHSKIETLMTKIYSNRKKQLSQ